MTAPSPGGVQRYLVMRGGHGEPSIHEIPDSAGDWVRYGDHAEAVAKITRESERVARWANDCVDEGAKARRERDGAYNDLRVSGYEVARLRALLLRAMQEIPPSPIINEIMAEALRGAAGEAGK